MIDVYKDNLPYQQKITYQMIKYLRLCRNMTQEQFGQVCKIDQSVLARLESGSIELSINYESRVLEGCHALNISGLELLSVKRIVELKQNRGIN
ncbi:helix-turn-helix transcriptional regulator [Bacillus mobilis]|uniref:Transcriptional regulator n=2 Tax=Bacillus cereus group TaxID=86661 RepID=A0A1C4EGJ9_BACCE|nr:MULTISPECIES: helix-turn-helix transcriptional regulator [Bacillus cereus group]OKA31973.1 transcriptional regulator [Bacillus cereus]OKA32947.1 transcriptional regulator [Bacillus cereus]SCC42733.1 C.AhdI domain protein [Bacillus mobilis]